jgi:hypothetical protein
LDRRRRNDAGHDCRAFRLSRCKDLSVRLPSERPTPTDTGDRVPPSTIHTRPRFDVVSETISIADNSIG